MDTVREIGLPNDSIRANIIEQVRNAALFITPVEPIYRFVAANPLAGLVHMPFGEAVERWHRLIDEGSGSLSELVNERLDEWMLAYFGKQAIWKPAKKAGGLFPTWRDHVRFDPVIGKRWQVFIRSLPEDPALALDVILKEQGIEESAIVPYLRAQIHQRVGLAGYLAWLEKKKGEKLLFVHLLAIRAAYTLAFQEKARLCKETSRKKCTDSLAWLPERWLEQSNRLKLREQEDERDLLELLSGSKTAAKAPKRQSIHCIDARSGALCGELEEGTNGDHQTSQVAGFFGVFMSLIKPDSKTAVDLYPPLVGSAPCVKEVSDSGKLSSWRALVATGLMWQKETKANFTATFGYPDVMGLPFWVALERLVFFPGPLGRRHKGKVAGKEVRATHLDLSAFSVEAMADMAEGCLRSIGLTEASQFASLVSVCAHTAKSVNNPFAHSLGCGACGGHSGEHNAIALCSMLNRKVVRDLLAQRGIFIPEETLFVPFLHNTTTDLVIPLTTEIPDTHKVAFDETVRDFKVAGDKLRAQREAKLPRTVFAWYSRARVRAYDAAQTLPEWGLCFNRRLIIGPRKFRALKKGNTFSHSYDYRKDPDGKVLNAILSGAGRVATGINLQYLFSALFPKTLGAGDKTLGNPASIIGVKRGGKGDFQLGLTEQSAGFRNGVLIEEPVRLLWVIHCPVQIVDQVLRNNDDLADLVQNGWARLIVSDPNDGAFHKVTGVGAAERLAA